MPFLAQVLAVIGPENNDRVLGVRAGLECAKYLASLRVNCA